MQIIRKSGLVDAYILFAIILLTFLSTIVLRAQASFLYPNYFIYLLLAALFFYIFLKIDFEIFSVFSTHLFWISVILLTLPLLIGQVTRGAIRWIPIGSLTIQPSELVRPFLILFFAKFITDKHSESLLGIIKAAFLFLIPFTLILIQPSLGVAILTAVGFLGVLLSANIKRRYLLFGLLFMVLLLPSLWFFLKPYQRERLTVFLDPESDRFGAGYHSIQSMISVGSGKIFGRGLGEGVQTQLEFLPEKHTDFIFAAIAEELGFVGAILTLIGLFIIFWRLVLILENTITPMARSYVSGIFLVLFVETIIHTGMNMGLLPITGIPLPFISAGGSALLGTASSIAIAMNAKKPNV